MQISNSAGAASLRRKVLRALTMAALLASPWLAATAAPVLSGTPAPRVTAAHYYAFQPGAVATAGKPLAFAIANKPAWAQFDPGTGRLYGTPAPPAGVGTFAKISISASDGTGRATLPSFSITVLPLPNTAPVIGGTPVTTVTAGAAYSFQPVARDPNGLRVIFAISNKPAWAVFNTATGALAGNPAAGNIGTYANIMVTAYDGYAKAQLPAFSISVQPASQPGGGVTPPVPPVPTTGSATLSWMPPTQTTRGTPLTNLAGYRIYFGPTPSLGSTVNLANPGLTRYVFTALSAATWYFQMTAYDKAGVESPPTAVASIAVVTQ